MAKDLALTTKPSSAEPVAEVDEETEQLNLELYLRLTFFRGSDERLLRVFDTGVVFFAQHAREEFLTVVLSSHALYILRNTRARAAGSGGEPSYALVTSVAINKIAALLMGLCFQYVRVEVDLATSYVLLFRSAKESERFVALMRAAAKRCNHHLGPTRPPASLLRAAHEVSL